MRLAAIASVLLLASAPANVGAAERVAYDPWPDGAITGGVLLLNGAAFLFHEELAPDRCRFCGTNCFDAWVTESLAWSDPRLAGRISDVGLVGIPVAGVAWGIARRGWEEGALDGLVLIETVAINNLLTSAIKYSVGRQRPMGLYLPLRERERLMHPAEFHLSFPSGHASNTFAAVAAAATLTSMRGEDPLPVWLVGVPLAAGVSWLRVAGYYHWGSDVLAGAALGTAVGILVPRLLHEPARQAGSSRSTRVVGPLHLAGTF